MLFNLQTATAAFWRVGIRFQKGTLSWVGSNECCPTAGVRIELDTGEAVVKAVKVLFYIGCAETCRNLIGALWEATLPGQPWNSEAGECIKCALERRPILVITDGIEIKLLLHGTEAELVASMTALTHEE